MISLVESKHLKKNAPVLKPGDVVRVHQRIVEAGKERIQVFEGLIISVSGSKGMDGSFAVRRIASGVGVERIFALHSPKIAKIERVKSSRVRRAKLYYIRELTGRKARLKANSLKSEAWEEGMMLEEPEDEKADDIENDEADAPKDDDFETVAEVANDESSTQDDNEVSEAEEKTDEEVIETDEVKEDQKKSIDKE